jgi:hypothetical protein
MRCAAPLELSVNRYELWHAMVLLLATGACAALFAWWWAQPQPTPRWASATAALGALISLVCLAGLWRKPALTLRWDSRRWLMAREDGAEQAGELAVAIDLGAWMLLRFVPAGRRSASWIALQRCGLEGQWHALRCAVYTAQPTLPPGPRSTLR